MKLKIILLLVLLPLSFLFSQSNLIVKPKQVLKLTWTASIEPDVWQYGIFWCQGADTTIFPFNTGTNPDSLFQGEPVSNWSFASVYDLKFHYEPAQMPGVTYVRLGVAPINQAGQLGLIRCIPKVITVKRPVAVGGVKVQ